MFTSNRQNRHPHTAQQLAENYTHNAAGPFALFSRRQHELKALAALGHEDYYSAYIGLYRFALVLSFGAQVASIASEYGYFEGILAVKLTSWPLTIAAAATVGTLELAKYFVLNRVFKDLFRLAGPRVPVGLALIALALSALSVYASIKGGGQLAENPAAIAAAAAPHQQEIDALRADIADIKQRNTWKGKTWIAGKEKALLHQKEQQLANTMQARETATAEAKAEEAANVFAYQYGFAGFEVVFILCTLFVWYFNKRTAVEGEVHTAAPTLSGTSSAPTPEHPAHQQQHTHTAQPFERPNASRPIGFEYGKAKQEAQDGNNENRNNENRNNENRSEVRITEGTRICKHCGQAYTHRHHKQLYCSDQCRIAFWENEHKRPIRKRKKQLDLF